MMLYWSTCQRDCSHSAWCATGQRDLQRVEQLQALQAVAMQLFRLRAFKSFTPNVSHGEQCALLEQADELPQGRSPGTVPFEQNPQRTPEFRILDLYGDQGTA